MVGRCSVRVFLSLFTCLMLGPRSLPPAPRPTRSSRTARTTPAAFATCCRRARTGSTTPRSSPSSSSTARYPPHFADQLPLYANLLYGSPTLTHEQIANYFKDATFGVQPGDVASTIEPALGRDDRARQRPTASRTSTASTRAGAMFGAGYAGAEDRLFLMDVLRHTGRAELSSFARRLGRQPRDGPHAVADRALHRSRPANRRSTNAPELYGADGRTGRRRRATNYVAGINAYIAAALLDPNKLPAEYAALGKLPEPWKPTDVIAEASLIGGIFGKGGGNEVRSALTLQALRSAFGQQGRPQGLGGLPRARTTPRRRPRSPSASPTRPARLRQDAAWRCPTRGSGQASPTIASAPPASGASRHARRRRSPTTARSARALPTALAGPPHASNWELVNASTRPTGHPIAVMGPQVGYYVPQILMEEDLHGPGIDARGAAFPGVNLYVELGHGRDYAWSATTATSDNVDTFAEVLCQDEFHYLYKGQCLPMEKLERRTLDAERVRPDPARLGNADRLPHGARHRLRARHGRRQEGRVRQRAHDLLPRGRLGDRLLRAQRTGLRDRARSSSSRRPRTSTSLFNWAYVDANHIAYYLSGSCPQRAQGTSPDFPILGTGEYDWQGFDPQLHTMTVLPFDAAPARDRPAFLVSWNNKQAPGLAAADDKYAYGSIYRMQLIRNFIEADIAGGKKMGSTSSSGDGRGGHPGHPHGRAVADHQARRSARRRAAQLQEAIAKLDSWYAARRAPPRPRTRDGRHYEHNDAITIMDAWWPKLLEAEFKPALGREGVRRARGDARRRRHTGGLAQRAGLRRRLVRLRQQGPARPARRRRREGRLLPRVLRRRLAGRAASRRCRARSQQALSVDAAADLRPRRLRRKPAGELLRHEPLTEPQRHRLGRRSRSRTARPSSRS